MKSHKLIILSLLFVVLPSLSLAERILGVGLHVAQGKISANDAQFFMRVANVNSFRDELYWSHLERRKGMLNIPDSQIETDNLFQNGLAHGYTPLLVLDYGNINYGGGLPSSEAAISAFSKYCAFVSARYVGRIGFYEIWNEWNAGMGTKESPRLKGSPNGYVELAKSCANEIRKNDPNAKILVGATAGYDSAWTSTVLKLGLMDIADGFSVHPYVFGHHIGKEPERAVNFVSSLAAQLEGFGGKPIYITEMGWPTSTDRFGVPEDLSMAYLSRFLLGVMTIPTVKGVWIYELLDGGAVKVNKESNFGLIRHDRSAKSSFLMVKRLSAVFRDGVVVESNYIAPNIRRLIVDLGPDTRYSIFWRESPNAALPAQMPALHISLLAPSSPWSDSLMSSSVRFPFDVSQLGATPMIIKHSKSTAVGIDKN